MRGSKGVYVSCLLLVATATVVHCAANVQFVKVLPEGADGHRETIVIKNSGEDAADLTGWSIVDTSKATGNSYFFGGDDASMRSKAVKWCANYTTIDSDQEFVLKPYERDRFSSLFFPCGFRYKLGDDGQLELRDASGKAVDRVSWAKAEPGTAIYRMGNTFVPFLENQDLRSSIQNSPVLSTFAKALKSTGVSDKYLKEGASIKVNKDSWMDRKLKQSGYEKSYYKGPWTVFAPNDAAWKDFMQEMGWFGMALTEEELLAMPELEEILKYHIIVGQEMSHGSKNSTGLMSMKDGSEVSVFHGPEGELLVHDDCVDSPSPDDYGCTMQAEWNKCSEDWVQDEGLFSGRDLGYCERSCKRCSCNGGQCGTADIYDIPAANGVLHVIDKVLYPAPVFNIPEKHWRTREEIEAELGIVGGV